MGPAVILMLAVGAVASTAIGAGQRPWTPSACAGDASALAAAAQSAGPASPADLRSEAWFRLDPQLDRAGELQGQRLAFGLDGDRAGRVMDLPPESFAAGPFGRLVLVGRDDGTVSRLEAVDVAGGCWWAVAEEPAVIRRATIDPGGTTIYEMRVARDTRADLGVWSRTLAAGSAASRVLEPIEADDRFGRTFITELSWELSGPRLAVQSCGEAACRTRVFDPASGDTRSVVEPDLGVLVGFEGDSLVTYAACTGFPCPIVTSDLRTGIRSTLADAATGAVVVATADGPRLVHEQLNDTGLTLRSVALDGTAATDVGGVAGGLRLHPTENAADAWTTVPAGWVLLSPDGRIPESGPGGQMELRHVPDGTAVELGETLR